MEKKKKSKLLQGFLSLRSPCLTDLTLGWCPAQCNENFSFEKTNERKRKKSNQPGLAPPSVSRYGSDKLDKDVAVPKTRKRTERDAVPCFVWVPQGRTWIPTKHSTCACWCRISAVNRAAEFHQQFRDFFFGLRCFHINTHTAGVVCGTVLNAPECDCD